MCGILGIYFFEQCSNISAEDFIEGLKLLRQRGPNNVGYYFGENVWLGHTRLAIIDTSEKANQPMFDETNNFIIILNGEIYNFLEIKNYLLKQNINFFSNSDTEVLLKYFIKEEKNILNKIIGDYAFVVYNKAENKLIIVRDRYGVKPLFYYQTSNYLIFSSEIKAILRILRNEKFKIDIESLYYYFQFSYIPAPFTIYKEIKKLLPYHYIEVKDKKVVEKSYYNKSEADFSVSQEELFKQFELIVHQSVREHLISDVPVGCFLSGGLDSSIIAAIANQYTKLKTFNVSFRSRKIYDETFDALCVAKFLNTDHVIIEITEDELFQSLFDFLNYIDEPYADSSVIALISLVRNVKNIIKVALTGDGGDELFAGYYKHKAFYYIKKFNIYLKVLGIFSPLINCLPAERSNKVLNRIRQLQKLIKAYKMNSYERYLYLASINYFADQVFVKKLNFDYTKYLKYDPNTLNNILLNDIDLVLPNDMLVKSDIASAINGFEIRCPLVDYRIVEFAKILPDYLKINKKSKWILRKVFGKLLPEHTLRKPKHGFEVPLKDWLTRPLKTYVDDLLNEKYIENLKILNEEYINQIKNRLYSKNVKDTPLIVFSLFIFLYWCKKNNISSCDFDI
ncbi:MAG: asparagine synthase (glutamine-hydrolyzing) [Bacteroidales bacterium]|nr:asparagine synthase (glutamine-hydrolyzing) [Bacteroidales bacterium]